MPFSQPASASQTNSLPLSLRTLRGTPRRATTAASTFLTSSPVIDLFTFSARHSLVYSSTSVSHLSGRPSIVRSATKSQHHTSPLNSAGVLPQLLAPLPRFGPSFFGFLGRTGRARPSSRQSRRTRLRLTAQPP